MRKLVTAPKKNSQSIHRKKGRSYHIHQERRGNQWEKGIVTRNDQYAPPLQQREERRKQLTVVPKYEETNQIKGGHIWVKQKLKLQAGNQIIKPPFPPFSSAPNHGKGKRAAANQVFRPHDDCGAREPQWAAGRRFPTTVSSTACPEPSLAGLKHTGRNSSVPHWKTDSEKCFTSASLP